MEQNTKEKEKKKVSDEQIDEDELTIFNETAHIPDRDDLLLTGDRIVQGGSATDIDDEWDPQDGDRLQAGFDYSPEAVDAQLEQSPRIRQDIRESQDHHRPTLAKPVDADDNLEDLSDEELMKYADVLGIPERKEVPRMKLIGLIRAQERSGL